MMLDNLREQLGTTDEEWKALQPRIEKVMDAQRAVPRAGAGIRGAMRASGGPEDQRQGGQSAQGSQRPGILPEVEALQRVLESKDSTKDQIKTALKAFREVRAKKEKELKDARQALREMVTVRQEAMLVLRGLLD